ncbi:MAG: hypothetical protein ACPIOQ_50645 [Promethearchaeia archaeon]
MMHVQVSMLEQMMREIKQAGRAGVLMADLHRSLGIDTRVAYDLALQLVQVTRVPLPRLCVGCVTVLPLLPVADSTIPCNDIFALQRRDSPCDECLAVFRRAALSRDGNS